MPVFVVLCSISWFNYVLKKIYKIRVINSQNRVRYIVHVVSKVGYMHPKIAGNELQDASSSFCKLSDNHHGPHYSSHNFIVSDLLFLLLQLQLYTDMCLPSCIPQSCTGNLNATALENVGKKVSSP